ncbi:FtsB family cell division protein [Shumkonia mesophila]|uniref:FtsB family cell division protein n=1 Tax=Shumkonia mesophila TaxID=2838854 RepID=UPI0029348725|nr:septum formation initiator family protein [Shumkonia mesophila]
MGLIVEIRSRARHVVGPILGICAVAYFAYHAVQGDRGLLAWIALKQRVATAQADLDQIAAQRKILEHRVSLLYPENLDPDLLDERARLMLNYGHATDIVIFPKSTKAPAQDPAKGASRPHP